MQSNLIFLLTDAKFSSILNDGKLMSGGFKNV